jgi:hypothetical protein
MKTIRSMFGLMLGFGAVVFLVGCGEKVDDTNGVKGEVVQGAVTKNGKPLKFLPEETVIISVKMGEGEKQISCMSPVDAETGAFTLEGPSGEGLPAGIYTIQVVGDQYGAEEPDRFARYFDNEDHPRSPLEVEISSDPGQKFEVDLGRWTVVRK